MRQLPIKRSRSISQEEEEEEVAEINTFFQCSELILPWLTSSELAAVSLTCKFLHQIAKPITLRRSSDASRGLETLPIPFTNSIDARRYAYFLYTPSQLLPPPPERQPWGSDWDSALDSSIQVGIGDLSEVRGCDCQRCGRGCPCLRFQGLEEVASECGPSCGCEIGCGNRKSQGGISIRLKIVRDLKKGWGLFADEDIKCGQFVCEYAGELLTTIEARKRQKLYDELSSSSHGFSVALLVVREHLPSGKACLRLNIDATVIGNAARFINHSCDGGNLSTVLVRSTGSLLPRLCFFASKDIELGDELSFSYGEVRVRANGLPCFCGSSSCSGLLPSEHT